MRHPVLGLSKVVTLFLKTADHKDWKAGKRLAEQQPVFLTHVEMPRGPLSAAPTPAALDSMIEHSCDFAMWLKERVGSWNTSGETMGLHWAELASSYTRMAEQVKQFDAGADDGVFRSWWTAPGAECPVQGLMRSLNNLGTGMEHVAIMMAQHNEVQMGSLIEALDEYSLLVASIPVLANGGAKWLEVQAAAAPAMGSPKLVLSNIVLAEFRHFHEVCPAASQHSRLAALVA